MYSYKLNERDIFKFSSILSQWYISEILYGCLVWFLNLILMNIIWIWKILVRKLEARHCHYIFAWIRDMKLHNHFKFNVLVNNNFVSFFFLCILDVWWRIAATKNTRLTNVADQNIKQNIDNGDVSAILKFRYFEQIFSFRSGALFLFHFTAYETFPFSLIYDWITIQNNRSLNMYFVQLSTD